MDNSKKDCALLSQRYSLELPTFQHRFNSNSDTVYFTEPLVQALLTTYYLLFTVHHFPIKALAHRGQWTVDRGLPHT